MGRFKVPGTVLFAVWGILLAGLAAVPAGGEFAAAFAALSPGWRVPTPAGMALAVLRHAATLAVGAALAAACWSAGRAPHTWLVQGSDPVRRGLFALPLGFGAASFFLLGICLTKLLFSPVILLSLAVLALLGWRAGRKIALPRPDGLTWLALAVPFALLPWVVAPEFRMDGWEYFLAGPERWIAAHGYSVRCATPPLYYPSLAEMLYTVPVMLDLAGAAKMLNGCLLLAGALAVSRLVAGSGMGMLLAAASSTSAFLVTCGKNEGFAGGLIMFAFSAAWPLVQGGRAGRGALVLSGVLGGLALSTKYLSILNVAWVPFLLLGLPGTFRFRRAVAWWLMAGAVALPWLVRNRLMVGDPFFPVLSGFFPAIMEGWDFRNATLWSLCAGSVGYDPRWPGWLGGALLTEQPAFVFLLPALLMLKGPVRRASLAALATYAAWFALFPSPQSHRWAFPALAAPLVLAGAVAATGPRIALASLLALGGVRSLAQRCGDPTPLPHFLGMEDWRAMEGRIITTLQPLHDFVRAHPTGGAILLAGEVREYRLPKPCLLGNPHASGEAPLFWRLVDASRTPDELLKRFRQLGVRRIVYNPVMALNNSTLFRPFRWTGRQVRLWADVFGRWWELEYTPARVDQANGTFYSYRLRRRPVPAGSVRLFHLPGAETLVAQPLLRAYRGDPKGGFADLRRELAGLPTVGFYLDRLGELAAMTGDYAQALRLLSFTVEAGIPGDSNFLSLGQVQCLTGRYASAAETLERARELYPDQRETAENFCAIARFMQALEGLGTDCRAAEASAGRGLAMTGSGGDPWRGELRGLLRAVRSLALRGCGREEEAKAELQAAVLLNPRVPGESGRLQAWLKARGRELVPKRTAR